MLPPFEDLTVTTLTIIAVSNLTINLAKLFKYFPVTEYVVVQKKRGRKRKIQLPDPNRDLPSGSAIFLRYGPNIRGTLVKKKSKPKKTKKDKNFFLNSVTVEILLERNKLINIKLSNNGKFQITGCKDIKHISQALQHLMHHLYYMQEYTGETIFTITESNPRVIINIVMKNYYFSLDFGINRYKLDKFISENDTNEFISLFEEEDKITYVNIKLPLKNVDDVELDQLTFDIKEMMRSNPYSVKDYTTLNRVLLEEYKKLDKEDQSKIKRSSTKKDKYHTFLVFQSGAIIQSGRGPEMKDVYYKFVNLITENKDKFIEIVEDIENVSYKTEIDNVVKNVLKLEVG